MISVLDLVDKVGFEPEKIYLSDKGKEVRIDYRLLEEKFGYPLNCLLELVPVDGHVYFIEHAWKNEIDIHCNSSILDLLKRADKKQFGADDQNLSSYLLLVQNALTDLRFGDEEGIMELVSLLEANNEEF